MINILSYILRGQKARGLMTGLLPIATKSINDYVEKHGGWQPAMENLQKLAEKNGIRMPESFKPKPPEPVKPEKKCGYFCTMFKRKKPEPEPEPIVQPSAFLGVAKKAWPILAVVAVAMLNKKPK
ncbi:MAG: hypothetical protein JWM96_989 [Alphaproteobacteria bacterium]|nr:hypothetical protein [Alphaproteobacteria bacterium]